MSTAKPLIQEIEKQERTFEWNVEGEEVKVKEEIKHHTNYSGREFITLTRDQELHIEGLKNQLTDEYLEVINKNKDSFEKIKEFIEETISPEDAVGFTDNQLANDERQHLYSLYKMICDKIYDYKNQLEKRPKLESELKKAEKIFEEMGEYAKEIKVKWAKDYKNKMAKERKSKK